LKLKELPDSLNTSLEPLAIRSALRAALNDATPCERSQRINRRNVGKTNRIGKESGSATVSITGV